jgi:hypothetical protein
VYCPTLILISFTLLSYIMERKRNCWHPEEGQGDLTWNFVTCALLSPFGDLAQIPLGALASEPFVMDEQTQRSLISHQIMALCWQAGFRPNVVQEAISEQAVIEFVAASMGIALVSACLSRLRTDEIIYRPLIELAASVEDAVVWKPDNPSPTGKAFLSSVREVAKGNRLACQGKHAPTQTCRWLCSGIQALSLTTLPATSLRPGLLANLLSSSHAATDASIGRTA